MALLILLDEVMLEVQNNHLKNLAPIGIFCLQVEWNRPEEDKVWYCKIMCSLNVTNIYIYIFTRK